ncbi:MAG TPA: PAS domain-containing protein, partial [Bryobacteraceae bacterium]|nr:PAS domain-containing protein [Bryobacteraceae bacterium]
AVLGREGIVEGTDYRGMKVVACLRHVPDTPWSLVAKVDAEEVYAPLRQDSLIFAVLVALLILGSAAMVGWIWRNQSARFYRQKYEGEMERRALLGHYDYLTRYANDVILLMDESGRIVEANDRAVDTYGYSREELLKSTISRLRAPSTLAQLQKQWSSVEEQKGLLFETLHLRRDGGEFPVEVSTRLIEIDGRKYRQSIIRDISERKQAETRIRSLNRLYAVLSGCSQVMVHARSEVELFQQVCRLSVELGGFALAWVGMIDAKTNRVNPVASAGESVPYLREITISAYQGPEAQGPVGSSIRSGRPAICNEIETDAAMTLWHDAARRWKLHSLTALPLRLGGKIVGILALYSSKAGFFNEEQVALAVEVACSVSYAMDSLEQERRRKHVEAELLASRERLEMALDAANEGLWDWCLTDDSSYLSPRYNTMLGYVPGELKSGTAEWYSLIHPEDRGRVERAVRDFIAGSAEPYSVEFRMRSKSGVYAWILSQGKVVGRDADGKPTRLVGTHTDIT